MGITVQALVDALRQFPPDSEIEIDALGYECDGVTLIVNELPLLEHDFGLNELHFVTTTIKGQVVD